MRKWVETRLPLLRGGEDPSAAPFAGARLTRLENGSLGGLGVVTQVGDWRTFLTTVNGVGTENNAVVGGGEFATQGVAVSPSAGVVVSWNVATQELWLDQCDENGVSIAHVLAYAGYLESFPPQITGFEMFGRYYLCPYGRESAATRKGMAYFDPFVPSVTVPTYVLGGGAASALRFRGIAKHRGGTLLGWGYNTEADVDQPHILRGCKYGDPTTWVPDTTPTSAFRIVVGTLNIPIVACAASGPYTIIGKTSEIFALSGDYSEQLNYFPIGNAHGPVSTVGMVSTGPLAVWMAEKGPAYSVQGGKVQLLASERVIRRMTTYQDLGVACAVHDAQRTRVGFLLRRQSDLTGAAAGGLWPDEMLWWDYVRDAVYVHKAPTTAWSIFTHNAVNPALNGPTGFPGNLAAVPGTTSAALTWDFSTGDSTSAVSIEYRRQGTTTYTVAGQTAVGGMEWALAGLDGSRGLVFEWRLREVKNGQYGAYTATQTFTLASVAAAPADVHATATDSYPSGGKTYVVVTVSWTQTEFSRGSTTRVYEGTTFDPAAATQVGSGFTSDTVSTSLTKLYGSGPFCYWVSNLLSDGTESSLVACLDNPVTYIP